jgi:hypothetical protein
VTRRVRISTKYTTKDGKRRKYLLLHALLLGRFLPPQHSLRGLPLLLSQAHTHTHTQTHTRSLPPSLHSIYLILFNFLPSSSQL